MFVVMGATGNVGSATANALLDHGEAVVALVHDGDKAGALGAKGAEIVVVDVLDVDKLRDAFRLGRRAFLLNPPARIDADTDVEERRTVAAILKALDGSELEKVVAESTMGAQQGERLGDLNVLWEFEQGIARSGIPASIIRAAYYMSNFAGQVDAIRKTGEFGGMFPVDFMLPMAAPEDLGRTAARLLMEPVGKTGLHNVEGPARYAASDVARAFADALGRPVKVVATPRESWVETFTTLGFSPAAADSYARMTGATLDQPLVNTADTEKGDITLEAYVRALVGKA